jgi:hypothetical protein
MMFRYVIAGPSKTSEVLFAHPRGLKYGENGGIRFNFKATRIDCSNVPGAHHTCAITCADETRGDSAERGNVAPSPGKFVTDAITGEILAIPETCGGWSGQLSATDGDGNAISVLVDTLLFRN